MNKEQLRVQFEAECPKTSKIGSTTYIWFTDLGYEDAFEGFKACAKIKDAEIIELKAQVEKMREALKQTPKIETSDGAFDRSNKLIDDALSSTPQSSLSDHDREIEIKVLEEIVAITQNMTLIPHAAFGQLYDVIENMIEERKNKS
jgi:hypothetical protein